MNVEEIEEQAGQGEAPVETPVSGRPKGFAAMDPERRREIARRGGRAAHARGTAHEFSSAEAIVAGRKGGRAIHVRRGRRPAGAETE